MLTSDIRYAFKPKRSNAYGIITTSAYIAMATPATNYFSSFIIDSGVDVRWIWDRCGNIFGSSLYRFGIDLGAIDIDNVQIEHR